MERQYRNVLNKYIQKYYMETDEKLPLKYNVTLQLACPHETIFGFQKLCMATAGRLDFKNHTTLLLKYVQLSDS